MMLDSTRRDEALEAGYNAMLETPSIANRVSFTLDEFKEGCRDFDVYGFFDEEPAGMVFLDKNHAHIAILNKYQGKCGKVIKQALSIFLENRDYLIADVHKDNGKAIKFVKKLGFKFKERNDDILTYILGGKNVL